MATLLRNRYRRKQEQYRVSAERMGLSIHEMASKYFSSGVILFDTPAIRAADPRRDLTKFGRDEGRQTQMADMDLLNRFDKDPGVTTSI